MNWKIKSGRRKETKEIKFNRSDGGFFSLHSVIVALLKQRGFDTEEEIENFIFPDYEKNISDPFLFVGMKKVMKRLRRAKKKKEKILISGDYDADGITATLVLREALDAIGLKTFIYIPHKENDGYGMKKEVLKKFAEKGVRLVFTVDCGVSNKSEVDFAKKMGMDVIVTDHHHIPPELPRALVIINPKLKDSSDRSVENLAGVGVAFKLAQAIYKTFLPEKMGQLKWLLDLVAIGTVADMVPLIGENRILVKYGLLVLSKTRRIGLQELFKTGRIFIDENNIPDTQKISFQIAPRINSASRMSHAEDALKLLSESNRVLARTMSLELENQNSRRQKETTQVSAEAEVIVKKSFLDKKFIFIAKEHFPIGTVGLVAGKIANKFNKPTAILKKGEVESKGSFRSIPQINIINLIEKTGDLLEAYGGHSQAAGITIKNNNLKKFYEKLNHLIEKELEGKNLSQEIEIDQELKIEDIDMRLVADLKKMEPFGQGNKEPVFAMKNLLIEDLKWVGNGEKHLKLFLRSANTDNPNILEAIGFNLSEKFSKLKVGNEIDVVFNLSKDDWNGNEKIQMKIIDLRLREE